MSGMEATIAALERDLPQRMSERRWRHTLGVAETALGLAERHGLPADKARLAALLHDCAKELAEPALESLVERGDVACDGFTLRTRGLHHTVVGCWVAREEFGVSDPEVLEAIRYHSIGAPGLGRLAAVIYAADWIEPGRPFAGREELERIGREDLDALLDAVAAQKVAHGIHRGRPVHPYALAYYNERTTARRPQAPRRREVNT